MLPSESWEWEVSEVARGSPLKWRWGHCHWNPPVLWSRDASVCLHYIWKVHFPERLSALQKHSHALWNLQNMSGLNNVTNSATATAMSTKSKLLKSWVNWRTSMPLAFVHLKSPRHLFTPNVCPTTKSHEFQEVQDSEHHDSLIIFHSEEPIFLQIPLKVSGLLL